MARTSKNYDGIDYFPLDVTLDNKFRLIEAKFGIIGFGVIIKLFQRIYAENGYYCKWEDDTVLIMAAEISSPECRVSADTIQSIIDEAVKRGLFDEDKYKKYFILTSHGIQKQYIEIVKRRKRVEMENNYLLLSASEIPENVNINGGNVNINPENADNIEQSKSKSKSKSKSENILHGADKSDSMQKQAEDKKIIISLPLNDKSLFDIYPEDIAHWSELYPAADVTQELRNMLGWLEADPKRKKTRGGIKRFIIHWLSNAQNKGGNAVSSVKTKNYDTYSHDYNYKDLENREWAKKGAKANDT